MKDLEEGMRRINEYSYPLEDARVREVYGQSSTLAKLLLVQRELKFEQADLEESSIPARSNEAIRPWLQATSPFIFFLVSPPTESPVRQSTERVPI